jgi:hypothetical protein
VFVYVFVCVCVCVRVCKYISVIRLITWAWVMLPPSSCSIEGDGWIILASAGLGWELAALGPALCLAGVWNELGFGTSCHQRESTLPRPWGLPKLKLPRPGAQLF